MFGILFLFIGYEAFQTTININTKGNIKAYKRTLAITKILSLKQKGDTTLIDDETNDHNNRYSGKQVNNYVCLENEKPCSEDNLYRIIGVFNNIKTTENGANETRIKVIINKYMQKEYDTQI